MELRFRCAREAQPGEKWKALFDETWPAYHDWFLREGEGARPSYLRAAKMLEAHMPELVPMWQRLCELGGGGDHVARLLSLYRPTPYLAGCSQAIWTRPEERSLLIRNYDYHPDLCEGYLLHSSWHGTKVIAMSDCLWGVLDGMNEHGLAVSLAFGGRTVVGEGFGIPLVLRYILEFCRDMREAVSVLTRVPSHMAYNVSILDAHGDLATVEVAPDRPASVSGAKVATNHQGDRERTAHAVRTHTLERERFLTKRLDAPDATGDAMVEAFLGSPLFNTDYEHAFGTLYTAAYAPTAGTVDILWRHARWRRSFDDFEEADEVVTYLSAHSK